MEKLSILFILTLYNRVLTLNIAYVPVRITYLEEHCDVHGHAVKIIIHDRNSSTLADEIKILPYSYLKTRVIEPTCCVPVAVQNVQIV